MKRAMALALLLALTPTGAADADFGLGPVSIAIERDEPADCALTTSLPCLAWHDPGTEPGMGDDEVILYETLLRASVGVAAPLGPGVRQDLDLRNATVSHDLFLRYHALDAKVDAAVPDGAEYWLDLDIDEGGIVMTRPHVSPATGNVEPWHARTDWDPNFYGYTYIHAPYTTYPRSIGNTLYLPWSQTCAFPFLLGAHGCDVRILHAIVGAVAAETPDVVLGAELHHVAAGTPEAAEPQGLALPSAGRAADAPPALPYLPGSVLDARHEPAAHREEPWTHAPAPPSRGAWPTEALAAQSAQAFGGSTDAQLPLVAAVLAAATLLAAALYHRLLGPRLLDHGSRRAIHAFVAANPGCEVAAVAAHMGVSYKTAQHHLALLERGGFLRVNRVGGRTRVHLRGAQDQVVQAAAMRHETRQRILWMAQTTPGVKQATVARHLAVSRSTLHAHVRVLERSGLVENRKGRLFPGPRTPPAPDGAAPAARPATP